MAGRSRSKRHTNGGVLTELVGGPRLLHADLGRSGLWPFLVDVGDNFPEQPGGVAVAELRGEPDVDADDAPIRPDRCIVSIDVRLTTKFGDGDASRLLREIVANIDQEWPQTAPTQISMQQTWPAYKLGEDAPIRMALTSAAARHLSRPPQPKVSGPSNIGNYLAQLGIAATAGLGVRYEGLHGTDERIELATVPLIQATYHEAVLTLLDYAA